LSLLRRSEPCDARYPKDREENSAMNGAVAAPIWYALAHCFATIFGGAMDIVGTVTTENEAI